MLEWFNLVLYQIAIQVNQTQPCFLNSTAGYQILQNCGFGTDYLKTITLPFIWASGGLFSLIVVAILVLMVYKQYGKVIYAVLIGVIFLPISYYFIPDQFLIFAIVMAFVGLGVAIWFVLVKQSND